ncbi:MAG: hypothetical protein AAB739_03785, partial [Patescibacteria group bacterium]
MKEITLAIRVPKTNETGPIVAEQIFATLHGFSKNNKDSISFEIANTGRQIKFYAHFPAKLRNLIEGQIYAQYPTAEIEEVEDYTVQILNAPEAKNAMSAILTFEDPVIYPIKRYTQFEDKLTRTAVDPISGITATLAKLAHAQDQAWIQVVVRPLSMKWRITYVKCLRIVSKGILGNIETLKKAYIKLFITRSWKLKLLLFPLYIFFWFKGITSGIKHS